MYDLEKKEYLISRDVDFYETEFSFALTHKTLAKTEKKMHVEEIRDDEEPEARRK